MIALYLIAITLSVLVGGCGPSAPHTEISLDAAGVVPSASTADLATVLAAACPDGKVDRAALARQRDTLTGQLRIFAVTGPKSTPALYPAAADQVAYWYNVRIAWSLELLARLPAGDRNAYENLAGAGFSVDGRRESLGEIDSLLLKEAAGQGEYRIAACAPGVFYSQAAPPSRPYSGEGFVARLAEEYVKLIRDEKRLVIDIYARRVYLPAMLWGARDLVWTQYVRAGGSPQANLLTALESPLQGATRLRLEDAMGYKICPPSPRPKLAEVTPGKYMPGKVGRQWE